jgi:hypothetical protein
VQGGFAEQVMISAAENGVAEITPNYPAARRSAAFRRMQVGDDGREVWMAKGAARSGCIVSEAHFASQSLGPTANVESI